MKRNKFLKVRMDNKNEKWEDCIKRVNPLPKRPDDIRTEFARDVTRILHCTAYRRLKHKTQVFFAPTNDHVCTRIEHVNHVSSISHTIAEFLGLNAELTNAIALGHDLGHAPFGHAGEKIIKGIVEKELGETFWHEKNSLYLVDKIETLEEADGCHINLTYAVRDGIICHCGEVDENGLFPREEFIDLYEITEPNKYPPFTWEGCIVKVSDKIAYLGRDIEDALLLDILPESKVKELSKIIREIGASSFRKINNGIIIHNFIIDLCKHSSPEKGICFSDTMFNIMNKLKEFNYKYIYFHKRLEPYKEYANLIINTIYNLLKQFYNKKIENIFDNLKEQEKFYPLLIRTFSEWLKKYGNFKKSPDKNCYKNSVIYSLNSEKDYLRAIIDFLAGMTDNFAKRVFDEIMTF